MYRSRILWGIFLCLGWFSGLSAQVLEDYGPHIEVSHKNNWYRTPVFASVEIDVYNLPDSEFKISLPEGSVVFVEGVLWKMAESDTSIFIGTDEMKTLFPAEKKTRELVVYKKGIKTSEVSVQKGTFLEQKKEVKSNKISIPESIVREKDDVKEFFFLAFFIVLALAAVFRTIFPGMFSVLFKPFSVFSAEDFSDSSTVTRIFSGEMLFYLVIINMSMALLLMTGIYYLELPAFKANWSGDLNYLFLTWFSGTGILILLSLFKFLWLKIFSFIFEIPKMEFPHFFYMLRIVSNGAIIMFCMLMIILANEIEDVGQIIYYLLSGFFFLYLFGLIMLWVLMTKKLSFKNFHLFSYICSSELIPFLILTKLLVG